MGLTTAAEMIKTKTQPLSATVMPKPEVKADHSEEMIIAQPPRRPDYPLMAGVLDALALVMSFGFISVTWQVNVATAMPFHVTSAMVFAGISAIWLVTLFVFDLYRLEAYYDFTKESRKLAIAIISSAVLSMGLLYLFQIEISRYVLLFHIGITTALFIGWRGILHLVAYMSYVANMKLPRRVMIIGSNSRSAEMVKVLNNMPDNRVEVVGVVTNDKVALARTEVLGNFEADLADLVREHKIDDVIITMPRQMDDIQENALNALRPEGVEMWVVPSYINLSVYPQKANDLDELTMVNVTTPRINKIDYILKRSFDIAVAGTLLLLVAPVMIMVAIAIKATSPGPVLFVQERVGRNGENFKIFKFRSMKVNADKMLDAVSEKDENGRITNHKRRNDPRVTGIGKFIRKTSLDELPQILNVLRGDMTLVGPRPELTKLVAEYEPWQRHRFMMRQGITGWWQVNGRSENPCHMSTDQDIYYINNFSFLLDIQILLMTLPALLKGKGAF